MLMDNGQIATWLAGMPIIHLGLSLLIIQQTKVSKGVVPLPVSCDNKLRLNLLQGVVLPGL